jgi:predicted nucleic acid-binding protein
MKIYVDTSVYGGMYDEEFDPWSKLFFEAVIHGDHTIVISDLVQSELVRAPQRVRDFVAAFPHEHIKRIDLSEPATILGNRYVSEEVVGKTSIADCYHIAMATIERCDLVVSWNFKHIVNVVRIRGYNGVNLIMGHPTIEIRNPREVFDYENNN